MDEANTANGLTIRRVPIDALHLDPSNARAHGEANLDSIAGSLLRFGQAEPLVVHKETGRVIGGNGRLVAMRKLGWTECDVVEVGLDSVEATALGIALNRTADLATWDEPALASLLEELRAEDAIAGIGFTKADIDELLAELQADVENELDDPGPEEPPEQPVSRAGDLWVLGDHRLLCGDSTSPDDVARLMGEEKATLLATDPPYLVDYDGTNHPAGHHKKAGRKKPKTGEDVGNKHWDKYIDPDASVDFFTSFLEVALRHCVERTPVYQWHATRRQALVEEAWKANGLLVHQTIIWVKPGGVLTRSHFLWQHEPCFYGWPQGYMPERKPPPSETTVWQISQIGQRDGIHPTQKPLEVFLRPMRFHTRPSEIVLEPFSGSGTQIIAAEQLGRKCRAMELSPAFVDVGVVRWQKATEKDAVLEATGQSFAEVAEERA